MTRDEAYQILNQLIKTPNLIKHHLACEVVMRALCKRLNPTADSVLIDKWGTTGLLHDADYELTKNNPAKHTLVLEEKIAIQLDPEIMYAIKSHNWQSIGVQPKSLMDWSIYCCDELTGLIVASALIHPDKKLFSLTLDFVLNRFNEKSFAQGANREQIKLCEETLKIPLNEFIAISLSAMQSISSQLGL